MTICVRTCKENLQADLHWKKKPKQLKIQLRQEILLKSQNNRPVSTTAVVLQGGLQSSTVWKLIRNANPHVPPQASQGRAKTPV